MKVVLDGFCRNIKGETLLCNPQDGNAIILNGAEDFILPLLSGEDIFMYGNSLAKKYDVPVEEVNKDLVAFYEKLSRQNLVKIDGRYLADMTCNDEEVSCFHATEKSMFEASPVNMFFYKHNCVAEFHVDITYACTEKCIHCYVPQGQCDYLPYDLVEKVLREFREQQGLTVQLSGGECMKHPDFARICRLCRKLDLNFIVLSNLTRCDEKIIEVLKETDPQFVNVSLYSLVPEEHDAITQIRGSWKMTMAAIDACQQAGIHIRLATPLLKANQHAYPALRKFAEERHVHLIPDCEIIPMYNRNCSNLCHACTPQEMESVFKTDKHFWNCDTSHPQLPDERVCVIGERLFLNAKGQYYGCSGMNEFVIGDAIRDTVSDVWNSDMMRWLRGLRNKDFKTCMNCEHSSFCKVCPAFNYNATGSLFETIPAKCALAEVKHRVFGEK